MRANEEDLPAAPAFPGFVPELLNIRPGVSHSSGKVEIEVPESQRQPGGHMQLQYMDFCPATCDLQFGRPQVAVDLLARSLQLEYETELGLAEACCFTASDPPLCVFGRRPKRDLVPDTSLSFLSIQQSETACPAPADLCSDGFIGRNTRPPSVVLRRNFLFFEHNFVVQDNGPLAPPEHRDPGAKRRQR